MLSRQEYQSYDLIGLSQLVAKGELSPVETVEIAIREIEAINPAINAVVVRQFEIALGELKHRKDKPRFIGMPYLAKDLHAPVKGLPLANGSRLLKDQVFDFDSTTFSRIRSAGFSILGRTNSPEFGLSVSTEPAFWGPTRNPHDTQYSAGGSSGGAAAAVASGMLPAAHATDSGGSIRIPAARCGLVGLKPTRGLNAFGPHRGDPVLGISHEHAVTKTVRDCAAILDITAGPDCGAPYFTQKPAEPFEELIKTPPGKLKIGFTTDSFISTRVDEECRDAVLKTAKMLEALGHHVEEKSPVFDAMAMTDTMIRVLMGSLAGVFQMIEAKLGRAIIEGEIEPMSMSVLEFAKNTSLADHLNRGVVLNTETRALAAYFDDYDILLTPMLADPALKLGVLETSHRNLDLFLDQLFAISPFAAPFNVTGQPAMNMPLHLSRSGMPIGVQLVGRFAEDAPILKLAQTLETY
jgi:amidase